MFYYFNQFILDTDQFRLSHAGEPVAVEPLVFNLLVYLIENRDRVITREELLDALWAGKVVTDAALSTRLKDARKAVRDDAAKQEVIKTIHGRGYQFVADVSSSQGKPSKSASNGSLQSPVILSNPAKPSVTIKPFINLNGDPEQEYFVTGLTWDIWAALAKIPRLIVVEGESPTHDPRDMNIEELGKVFNVQYVIQGGVRKSGNQIRINVELVEVSTGNVIWGERYDAEPSDWFRIQDEITEKIVTSMHVKLVSGDAALFTREKIKNPEALDKYYRGESTLYGATSQELQDAQYYMEEVIRLEPESPLGYAIAAYAYWIAVYRRLSDRPDETLERAVELAQESVRRKDTSGYPHMILAHYHLYKRQFDSALDEANRGVNFRPGCPGANAIIAAILIYLGRPSEAIDYAEHAVRLQPVNPSMYPAIVASAYCSCGRFEEAIAAARTAINLDKKNIDPYLILAASQVGMGELAEANKAVDSALNLRPEFNLNAFASTQPYQKTKDLNQLIELLKAAGFT